MAERVSLTLATWAVCALLGGACLCVHVAGRVARAVRRREPEPARSWDVCGGCWCWRPVDEHHRCRTCEVRA